MTGRPMTRRLTAGRLTAGRLTTGRLTTGRLLVVGITIGLAGAIAPAQDRPGSEPVYPTPSNNGRPAFEIKPRRLPPAVPPVKVVPLDTALRQKAVDALAALSTDGRGVIRANVIEAAQRTLGADGARTYVIRGLSDDAAVVRFAACVASGDLQYTDTRPVLYKLAYDIDPGVRLAARYGLHRLGDSSLTQEMLLGLRDDRSAVRGNTAMLLGMLGEKSAIKSLRMVMQDPAPAVRLQAGEAVWRLDNAAIVRRLEAGSREDTFDDLVARTISRVSTNRRPVVTEA